jgi:hypothetical protein
VNSPRIREDRDVSLPWTGKQAKPFELLLLDERSASPTSRQKKARYGHPLLICRANPQLRAGVARFARMSFGERRSVFGTR